MTRLLFAAALALPAAAPANDIVDFFRDIADRRREAERRQQDYRQRYDQRYVPQQAPPPVAIPYRYPDERTLSPWQSGLEPGWYDTTLPGGGPVRLHVEDRGGRARPAPRPLLSEATALRAHAEALLRTANSVDDRGLQSSGERLRRAARRLADDLQDNDLDDARRESQRFTEAFDEFGRLIGRYRVGPSTAQRLRDAEAVSERIAFGLASGGGDRGRPALGVAYDRPRLLTLTGYLEERTGQLAAATRPQAGDFRLAALGRDTQRVADSAAGLRQASLQGADFDTLVRQYRRFDRDWHELLDSVRRLDAYPPQLVEVGRRIWSIDWGLSEVLLVDAAYFSDADATRHVAERLGSSTRRLDREMQLLAVTSGRGGGRPRQIVELAGDLAREADALARRVEGGRSPQALLDELTRGLPAVQARWAQLRDVLRQIDYRRPEVDLQSLLNHVETDVNRLGMATQGRFEWRL